jgi:DNA-binding beta-propeller fold protein YncE
LYKNIKNIVLVGFVWLMLACAPPKNGYSVFPRSIPSADFMTTIAGNGTIGYGGDGGAANQASLSSPTGVAVDLAGNVYIADRVNNRIRKVAAGSGIISTIVGTGVVGYNGDGGPANAAELNNPSGVAVDGSGNIYIADAGNHCIRKITANSGIITTIAGTGIVGFNGDAAAIATAAKLSNPTGIALDLSGNIYIADLLNNRIRKITAGIISTIAGGGTCSSGSFCGDGGLATAAALYRPMAIALDASGNIYIADTGNNRIRIVSAETGVINTIVGTGLVGFSGDGGQATAAQLYNPYGVAVDSYGNVYVADNLNNRIREVEVGVEIISTVAGNGVASYAGDGWVPAAAELHNPYGIAIDVNGNIYVADCNNQRIRRFN